MDNVIMNNIVEFLPNVIGVITIANLIMSFIIIRYKGKYRQMVRKVRYVTALANVVFYGIMIYGAVVTNYAVFPQIFNCSLWIFLSYLSYQDLENNK